MPILFGVISSAVGVPGAPTIGTVTVSGTTATVPFTAPADSGGSSITSYTAVSSPGGISGTLYQSGSGSITVSGLSGGVSYTFTVYATNAFGNGPSSSASNSITAVVPVGISASRLLISSVYNGGLRSSNYTIDYSDNASSWTTAWSGVASNNTNECGVILTSGGGGNYGSYRYWRFTEGSPVSSHFPRISRLILRTTTGTEYNMKVYSSDNCSDSGEYQIGTVRWDQVTNSNF